MAVELNPYLFFPGSTEQAIAFYQQVFGGQVTITRRGDVDPTATAEEKDQVVNALLTGGDITLRASDRQDAGNDPQTRIELSLIGTTSSGCGHYSTAWPPAAQSGPSWTGNSGATSSAPSPTSTAWAGRSTSVPPAPDAPSRAVVTETPAHWGLRMRPRPGPEQTGETHGKDPSARVHHPGRCHR